ncbi:MAG: polysaccharide deacetylase family protein [Wenzhouxiangella sp.]
MMKEWVRSLMTRVVVHSGAAALGRKFRSHDGALILYGHRVADDDEGYMQGLKPEWLDQQLAYLTRHYEVIPLRRLVECLEQGAPVPSRTAVLTFDDGFRDNYQHAFPLLQKYRVPATIFTVTGALTHGELPWSQRLGYLFQNTPLDSLTHALGNGECLTLEDAAARKRAYRRVKPAISRMPRAQRDAAISELSRVLEVEPPRDRMMTWDHAREMQAAGIELGAHTVSHPLLAEMPLDEALLEIKKSRDNLRRELGIERPSFCFPAGSLNAELLARIPELGFYCTFLPGQGIRLNNAKNVGPYTLSRVGLPNAPAIYLEAELDGPFHALRRMAGRA